jgi:glutathione S-transferase
MSRQFIFYHSPKTRSSAALTLAHELGAVFELTILNMKIGEQRRSDYLAINPMGKVPAIVHNGAVVTEQVAVFLYLADLWPEAGLAPLPVDPMRGPYLRWMAMYGSSFEPAIVDRALKREPTAASISPYGDFDTLVNTIASQLKQGPWILGDTFSAADVLWGAGLSWTMAFKLLPESPVLVEYAGRVAARPAAERVRQFDALVAAEHAEVAASMENNSDRNREGGYQS